MTTTSAIPGCREQTKPAPPRLLDVLQQAAAERGHSIETIRAYGDWTRRFILFHGKRHPSDLTNGEVGRFLGHVAQTDKDALRTIEAARTALDFLYREVLHVDRGELPWAKPPRLLDQVRQVLRVKHYCPRTEKCYVHWVRRYLLFHGKRHPRDMSVAAIEQFLTHLAMHGHVSASTQNQALNGVLPECEKVARGHPSVTHRQSWTPRDAPRHSNPACQLPKKLAHRGEKRDQALLGRHKWTLYQTSGLWVKRVDITREGLSVSACNAIR